MKYWVILLPLALSACQRFDESVLDCEREYFLTKEQYYQCHKARDLHFIRKSLEFVNERECCSE